LFSLAGQEQRLIEFEQSTSYEFQTMESVARNWSIPERSADDPSVATAPVPVSGGSIQTPTPTESDSAVRVSTTQILGGVWIGGAMVFLGWCVVRQIRVRRLVRSFSESCTDDRVNALFAQTIRRVGVQRSVELLVGPYEVGPATFGVLRPKIIVSQSLLDTVPERELTLVFGHELVHVRRWDTLHALVQSTCQALLWFHPLVWWGNRKIVQQRECCCDEELVAALCRDPAEYAECLVSVLRQRSKSRVLPGMAGLGPLELTRQRLEMIMNFDDRLHVRPPRKHWLLVLLLGVILLPGAGLITATEPPTEAPPAERLDLIQTITADTLNSASFVVVSPNGRHAYVTAWMAGAITVYSRDQTTGRLTEQQVVQGDDLSGVTDLRVSADGRIAVASCCHSNTAVVFERSPISGMLHQVHVARHGEIDVDGLYFPIDVALSPDGQFAYVSDSRRPGRGSADAEGDFGRVTTFRINDDASLAPVDTLRGPERCLDGVRGICSHPDGRTLFAVSQRANRLVVLDRNDESGKISVRQVLSHDKDDLSVLNGAMTAACSPDGQFVYTAGGRFLDTSSSFGFSFLVDATIQRVEESKPVEVSPQGIGVFRRTSEKGEFITLCRSFVMVNRKA
jgi:beta-lactamase regulating signal transducer with metallopeptidase domain/6-phosphogluconolactonase (cycloisomerase 2 family)